MAVSSRNRTILRDLARRVAEIGHDPQQEINRNLWRQHNSLESLRPLVLVFPEGSWCELLPREKVLECDDPSLHEWEWLLRHFIYRWEHLRDDNVIEPRIRVNAVFSGTGWGVEARHTSRTEERGSWGFDPVLRDIDDLSLLKKPTVELDEDATARRMALAHELFDGVLPVTLSRTPHFDTILLTQLCELTGLQTMFAHLADNPGLVHGAMEFMTAATLELIDKAEREGWVEPNNEDHYVGSGGVAYTDELPAAGSAASGYTFRDCWGFSCAQEFSLVSPQMHYEFALQYQIRLLRRFGLNCYACCEPVSDRFDLMFRIPRLRRLSVSPWADLRKSAEALGDRVIFSWKPNPADLAGESFDPEHIRATIRNCVEIARGCVLEIIMKDTHTVRGEPQRMSEWVRIARKVAESAA